MPLSCCAITKALKTNPDYQFENEAQCCAYKLKACKCRCASTTFGGNASNARIENVEIKDDKLYITVMWDTENDVESYIVIPNQIDTSPETTLHNSYTFVTSWANAPNPLNIDVFLKKMICESCSRDSCMPGFVAGSKVIMADRSEKVIEDVRVGEYVLGAFGQMNQVQAIHKCMAGDRFFTRINNELTTPINTAFVGNDKKLRFRCSKTASDGYGRFEKVIDSTGTTQLKHNYGVEKMYMHALIPSDELKTLEGSKKVEHIEELKINPSTILYSLAISQDHTHYVDSYAVGGWPNSYDFDYDAWMPK